MEDGAISLPGKTLFEIYCQWFRKKRLQTERIIPEFSPSRLMKELMEITRKLRDEFLLQRMAHNMIYYAEPTVHRFNMRALSRVRADV